VIEAVRFWRTHPDARPYFIAHGQGAIGDAAGYVALLLLAYDRLGSAWAATGLILADLGPAMLLGPVLGALVDRHGRLRSAIVSDVIRAVAFGALLFVHGAGGMIALAVLAGVGTALFRPATGALLPSLTTSEHLGPANALASMLRDSGQLLGPALAAGLLLVAGPEAVLGVNAVTFVVSALLLTRLRGHLRPPAPAPEGDRPGVRVVLADARARALMVTSGVVTLAGGTLNVSELALSQHDLRAGGAGLALLIGAMGVGLMAGSSLGPSRASCPAWRSSAPACSAPRWRRRCCRRPLPSPCSASATGSSSCPTACGSSGTSPSTCTAARSAWSAPSTRGGSAARC
jgi:MFS family permease